MPEKLVIAGVPLAGKSTLAAFMENVRHTDDLVSQIPEWSAQSSAVLQWFREPGPWVIEGCMTVRAMRKWIEREGAAPCDRVIWMPIMHTIPTVNQYRMAKGIKTMWEEIAPKLLDLGVQIERKGT